MDRNESEIAPVVQAPAIGYSVICNLGEGRQMTVQCFVEQHEDDATINTKVDRVMRIADRQKARYDLEKEETEFRTVGMTLRNFLDQIPLVERNLKEKIARLNIELQAKQDARKEVFDEGYNRHAAGRPGTEYRPKGHVQTNLDRMDQDIAKTEDAIKAAPMDKQQHFQELVKSIKHYQQDITVRRAKINGMRSLVGRDMLEDFKDEEFSDPPTGG